MLMVRKIIGTSMMPTFKPGSLVVGVRRRSASVGDIVIASVGGREIIKRVASVGQRGYYLLGDNPVASTDSRHIGWLQSTSIKSVVLGRRR